MQGAKASEGEVSGPRFGRLAIHLKATLATVAAFALISQQASPAEVTPRLAVEIRGSWNEDPQQEGRLRGNLVINDQTGHVSGSASLTGHPRYPRLNLSGEIGVAHISLEAFQPKSGVPVGRLTGIIANGRASGALDLPGGSNGTWTSALRSKSKPRESGGLRTALRNEGPQKAFVILDARNIRREAAALRRSRGVRADDAAVRAHKRSRYSEIKGAALSGISGIQTIRTFDDFPMSLVLIDDERALNQLLRHSAVRKVNAPMRIYPELAESLPLIEQPAAIASGVGGDGIITAIIDTGVDFVNFPAFGNCTIDPSAEGTCGVDATNQNCGIIFSQDFTNVDDDVCDDPGMEHGTGVAAVALATAPNSKIASFDVANLEVIDGKLTQVYDEVAVCDAVAWIIDANVTGMFPGRQIRVANMSFGGDLFDEVCDDSTFATMIAELIDNGILVVASTGNENLTDQISSPGCEPDVVRVGAVYDSDTGAADFGICNDPQTSADMVVCTSNSASFLTMLSPGSIISTAGLDNEGTSFAAPHVSGAAAAMMGSTSPFAGETSIAGGPPIEDIRSALDCLTARLKKKGDDVVDSRTTEVFPRLNMNESLSSRLSSTGDCNADGEVIVDELMVGVNIALNQQSLSTCPSFDADSSSSVTVDEVITGINVSLTSCALGASGNP